VLFPIRPVGWRGLKRRLAQVPDWLSVIIVGWLVGTVLGLVTHWCSSSHDATVGSDTPHPTAVATAWNVIAVRESPVGIQAGAGFGRLVPRSKLRRLLESLVPRWDTFKTSRALHALRLWGPRTYFGSAGQLVIGDRQIFTGPRLLGTFLDQDQWKRESLAARPLLVVTPYGVRAPTLPDGHASFAGTFAHPDDLLRVCAELGIPSTKSVRIGNAQASVADLVRDSLARFDSQQELPWTAEALARYLAPCRRWTNRFGETYSFDDLVDLLVERPTRSPACYGTHIPYALICLSRIDNQTPILNANSRRRVRSYLLRLSQCLEDVQQTDGSWGIDSMRIFRNPNTSRGERVFEQGAAFKRIATLICTGHHLEWISLAPPDRRPSNAVWKKPSASFSTILQTDRTRCRWRTTSHSHTSRVRYARCAASQPTNC